MGCVSLTEINLGKVTEIGSNAFSESSLVTVDLSACEKIDIYAFVNNHSLTEVTFGKDTYVSEGAFSYCPGFSSSWSQGKVVCLGLDEADVNATSLSVGTRRRVFDMLGLSMGKPFDESDGKRFFEMIGEK
jgi:hypothetical protein